MSEETTAQDVQREEAALLESLRRRRAEREALKAETIALEALLEKQTKFVHRMERLLAMAEAKQHKFERERKHILSVSGGVH